MGQRFARKVVVVTGASSGIGRATAHAFAREGARLVLGARRKEMLEEAAARMRHGGREARAVPCNVTAPAQVKRLIEAATSRWDRLDVVVANAGVGLMGAVEDTDREDFRHVLETNVVGVFNTVQAALPHMRARGTGTLVIVSSVLGYRGVPGFAGYCATKAALVAFSEALRAEVALHGIHVCLACPGLTESEFFERRLGKPGADPFRRAFKAMTADAVGEAIVDAVARHRRRVVMTASGKMLVQLSRHAPRLADRLVDVYQRRAVAAPPASPDEADPAVTP